MPGPTTVLYGREGPLAELRGALDAALRRRGSIALISGDPGIGKSALAAEIARAAEDAGASVTWGRAWELADAPAYFPVWPCLRSLGIALGREEEKRDESDAFHLWENVVSSLARDSARAPVVWILEDLHAADLSTLDLLMFLAQPIRAMNVLVVATARAKDPRLTERKTQRLTRIGRDGLDARLEPLGEGAIAALTEQTLGRTVPARELAHIADLTGGNPLFVVECARAFRAAGGAWESLATLPPTIMQVVNDRVALLPASTREALACGAILGREMSAAVVARMQDTLPARVIDTLLPALRAGVITEARAGQFVFTHMLVRDAIEGALGAEERARLHGRAERALGALGDGADVLLERARHALLAVHPGDEPRVLGLAQRAAEVLENEGAFDRAFEQHVRIDDARAAGLLPPASLPEKLHYARMARAAGRADVSRRLCEEVAAAARGATGDPALLAQAALLYGADLRPGVIDGSLVVLLEEARASLGEAHPELGCRVLARLSAALQPALDPMGPVAMAREALACARQTADDDVILDVLEMAGSALVDYAPIAERLALAEELLARATRANDIPKALRAHARLAFDHMEGGDFAAFERDTENLLELSDRFGHPRYRWRALLIASARAIASGRVAESERCVVEVTQLAGLIDDPGLPLSLAAHGVCRAKHLRRDADVAAEIARLEQILDGVPRASMVLAVIRASIHARLGDAEATRQNLAVVGGHGSFVDHDISLVAWLAEANALAGIDDERRRLRDVLVASAARDVTGGQIPYTYEGPVARFVGLLEASLGNPDRAESLLRDALARARERRHLPWVAQIAAELARVLRTLERESEARALEEEGLKLARDLGMSGLEAALATTPTARVDVEARADARSATKEVTLALAGTTWQLARGGKSLTLKDSRGMRMLARLVERPDQEIHALALASDDGSSLAETSAGEMIDERAKKEYGARLRDLEEELAEAERDADLGRAERLRGEREALQREIARAVGLGGRARQAGSATERARVNVQRRVKDAIARIGEIDPELGRFFERSVRTGTFCCFRP